MSVSRRYAIPSERVRVEDTIDRSRFITTLGHAAAVDEARSFVDAVAAEFADATHNCWAYQVGPPGDTSRVGMSDDGEPHGTAGRPMLHVLIHSNVGDIVAVVTRYYGGVKLGKGGLARAYSGGVKHALEKLPTHDLVATTRLDVTIDYALLETVKHSLPDFEVAILAEEFGERVVIRVELPDEHVEPFTAAVAGVTSGTAKITRVESSEAKPDETRFGGTPPPETGENR